MNPSTMLKTGLSVLAVLVIVGAVTLLVISLHT